LVSAAVLLSLCYLVPGVHMARRYGHGSSFTRLSSCKIIEKKVNYIDANTSSCKVEGELTYSFKKWMKIWNYIAAKK